MEQHGISHILSNETQAQQEYKNTRIPTSPLPNEIYDEIISKITMSYVVDKRMRFNWNRLFSHYIVPDDIIEYVQNNKTSIRSKTFYITLQWIAKGLFEDSSFVFQNRHKINWYCVALCHPNLTEEFILKYMSKFKSNEYIIVQRFYKQLSDNTIIKLRPLWANAITTNNNEEILSHGTPPRDPELIDRLLKLGFKLKI